MSSSKRYFATPTPSSTVLFKLEFCNFLATAATTNVLPVQKPQTTSIKKSKPYQIRANVDPYSLILAIRRHPNIYESCTMQEKLEAWTQVSQKMNTSGK